MTPKEVAKRDETAVEQIAAHPSWLVEAARDDTSKEALKEHLILPQLRIVPSQPGERMKQYKEQYGEGALVVTPGGTALAPHDTWVKVVPVFMFTEYRKWSDREDTDSGAVLERTFDPTSDVAKRAKQESLRSEPYGDMHRMVKGQVKPFMFQYIEHICFTIMPYDAGPLRGMPMVLEFQRGSHWKGEEFASSALMRHENGLSLPLWTQVWEIQTRTVTKKGYTWWMIEYRNCENGQLRIGDDEADTFRSTHVLNKESYESKNLVVDLSEADDAEARAVEAEVVDDGEM